MVSYLPILTFSLIFVTIFSSSNSISCHVCQETPECAKMGGGEVYDCNETDVTNPTGCLTIKYTDGIFTRECLNQTAVNNCAKPINQQYYKCKTCTTDKCNTDINF